MLFKKSAALTCILVLFAGFAQAQTTGEIYGKVTEKRRSRSGAVVPGATVNLTSPVLIQPQTTVTSRTGLYRFPRIGCTR